MTVISQHKISVFFYLLFTSLFLNQINAKEVSIENSELRQLYAKNIGQNYQLMINLPMNFDKSRHDYPVIYVLDAQWDFPLISAAYGQMYFDGFVPAAVVVGITWDNKDDPNLLRVRDFTPSNIEQEANSGSAANFLKFIKTELIPFIDKEYGTSQQRVLMGSSLGGLFTLYTLFNEPQLFSGYIPTASASGWDNGVLFDIAKKNETRIRNQLRETPVKLYSAVGSLDPLKQSFAELDDYFKQKAFEGLSFDMQVLPNLGHAGVKSAGNSWGLQAVFKRPELTLSTQQLAQWTGQYKQTTSDEIITIEEDKGHLVLKVNGCCPLDFYAESSADFYQKGQRFELHFKRTDTAKNSLQIEQFGSSQVFIQLKP
jgi:predicted alpha/beta superfamily hydrolase